MTAPAAPSQTQKAVAEPAQTQPASSATLKPGQTYLDRLNTFKIQKPLTEQDEKARVTKVAGDLVANALILPVMKQIRRSVWAKDGLFTGGIGEKTFGPEFDMQIADRIAHSPRMAVTNSLAQRLIARANKFESGDATREGRNTNDRS